MVVGTILRVISVSAIDEKEVKEITSERKTAHCFVPQI
jgi:hypothetical protein